MGSNLKVNLHKRNIHRDQYDFIKLIKTNPSLEGLVINNPNGEKTIDFSNPESVLLLNQALIKAYYNVDNWTIPSNYLCPAIPGRADYIHYVADLLSQADNDTIPRGKRVHVLDIGTGSSCVYPIIGSHTYGWKFTATEVDPLSLKTSRLIVQTNKSLSKQVKIIQQKQKQFIFRKIIQEKNQFDLTICNPPFFTSKQEALASNIKKWENLNSSRADGKSVRNFGGSDIELWCPGGELLFIKKMINESSDFSKNVLYFSTLVSKKEHITILENYLKEKGISQYSFIPMEQGHKKSRILFWTFLTEGEQKLWAENRWH